MKFIYRNLFRMPYSICYIVLKIFSKLLFNIDVWPRHSYINQTFTPFKSDLDISIFLTNNQQRKNFVYLYSALKKVFPFLGEVNCYSPEILNFLKQHNLNICELDRDPILMKRLQLTPNSTNISFENILVFLQRTFISDYENLRSRKNRKLKWLCHFSTVNSYLKYFGEASPHLLFNENEIIPSLSGALINLSRWSRIHQIKQSREIRQKQCLWPLDLEDAPEAELQRNELLLLVELTSNQNHYKWTPLLPTEYNSLLIYFPEYVCYYDFEIPNINPDLLSILIKEIEWFVLINLRKTYCPEMIQHGLRELDLFFRLLTKVQASYPDIRISTTQTLLTEAKNLLISITKA